jgi:hypothetical protein
VPALYYGISLEGIDPPHTIYIHKEFKISNTEPTISKSTTTRQPPQVISQYTKPLNMRVLLHQLSDISYQWKLIGIDLEVNQNILKGLQQKTIDDMLKLSDVLQAWFDKNEEITWEKIIEVVEGRIIDNKTLADKIKQFLEN